MVPVSLFCCDVPAEEEKKLSIGHGCQGHCGAHRRLTHSIATAREGNCDYKYKVNA
jgi:hypothetical protein